MNISISRRTLTAVSLFLLYIPMEIFLLTWAKPLIGMPAAIGSLVSVFLMLRHEDKEVIKINIPAIAVFMLLVIVIMLAFGAFGIFNPQHYDWVKHNTVLLDLIENDWPVTYDAGGSEVMLTYYIGMYLVPAIIGKALGFAAALAALYIQLLVVAFVAAMNMADCVMIRKEKTCLPLRQMLITFGVMLLFTGGKSDNFMTGIISYVSFTYVYMAGMLTLRKVNSFSRYFVIWLPMAMISTLSTACAAVALLIYIILRTVQKNDIKGTITEMLHGVKMVLPSIISMAVVLIYLIGNVFQQKDDSIGLCIKLVDGTVCDTAAEYIACITMIIVVFGLLFKKNRRDMMYWAAIVSTVIAYVIYYGLYNDVRYMLAGMADIFIGPMMTVQIIDNLEDKCDIKKKLPALILIALSIASIPAYFEGYSSHKMKDEDWISKKTFRARQATIYIEEEKDYIRYPVELIPCPDDLRCYSYGTMGKFTYGEWAQISPPDLKYNYFSYDYKSKLFWKVFVSHE